jgi:8-oxo-dGTP diphosphatase
VINCIFENGNKDSLRHVTVNTIVIKDNQVLLGKRGSLNSKPIPESGKWGLLGGFFDRDENLVQAAKREILEESGWEIDDIKLFRINDNPNRPKEDRQNLEFIFFARGIKQVKTPDEEVRELKWFDLDKLPPKDLIAFDHEEDLEFYISYLKNKVILPLLG